MFIALWEANERKISNFTLNGSSPCLEFHEEFHFHCHVEDLHYGNSRDHMNTLENLTARLDYYVFILNFMRRLLFFFPRVEPRGELKAKRTDISSVQRQTSLLDEFQVPFDN